MDISYASLKTAFHRVKKNQGCAGVDGVTITKFEKNLDLNLRVLQDKLFRKVYTPLPLMKILVPKKDGGQRSLCISAICDRVVQTAVLHKIEPLLDGEFEDCSYAYRRGRSVRQAIMKIREYHGMGYQWVVDADIDDFFNSVDHELLIEKIEAIINDPDIVHLIRLWLKVEIWDGENLTVPEKGIPQGSSISPVLANLFLDELDEKIENIGYKYVRYADDYIILGKNEAEARNGLDISKQILEGLKLELDEEEITTFEKGFKYLGVLFLDQMIVKPYETERKKGQAVFPKPLNMALYLSRKKR